MSKIPELRFKEFSGDWKFSTLGSYFTFKNGINATKEQYGKGYKFINVLDIINNNTITHKNIIGSVDVKRDIFEKNIVEYGNILFQRSSEVREEAGQSIVYLDKEIPATFGGFVIRGKAKKDYYPEFMNYMLKTNLARKEITTKSNGSTRYNVGQETLSKVFIYVPLQQEQEKVASFLTSVDTKIEQLTKKESLLQEYKKGVMQKIFNQEIRFKDDDGSEFCEWGEKKLGELCKIAKSGGTPTSTNKSFYDGDIPFLAISDITKQGKYLTYTSKRVAQKGLDSSASWVVPVNTIIYSMYASVGFVSINKIPLATSQAVINLILKDEINTEYIYYYLLDYKKYIHKYIETGTQGNLNAQSVKSLKIKLPSLEEQMKIANFLSSIDKKIENAKQELEKTKEFKKALLQQMFV